MRPNRIHTKMKRNEKKRIQLTKLKVENCVLKKQLEELVKLVEPFCHANFYGVNSLGARLSAQINVKFGELQRLKRGVNKIKRVIINEI